MLALAALPYASRVSPFDAESGSRTIEIGSTRWLISRLPPDRIERLTDGCLLGDPAGTYGDDYVCLSTYAEILQIDTETERIIRAYPFPELPPQQLLLADEAIYCVRQGDGGVPDSMLCRIDPDNGDALVRVFPDTSSSWFVDETTWTPPNWIIDDPTDLVLWQTLEATDSSLTITGSDGTASVDPDTLELLTDQ